MSRKEKLTLEELICMIEEGIDEPRQDGGNLRHKEAWLREFFGVTQRNTEQRYRGEAGPSS